MTFPSLKRSFAAITFAGTLVALPLAAQAPNQYQDQYPNQNQGQYQNPSQDGPAGPPPADMQYGGDQGAPSPGAPSGIETAPPAIPDYQQPESPGDGYIWTPGYWAWTSDGYQWVNGAWVLAPYTGALWTPGYWGDGYDGYFWNAGYWGPVVGYYGGINYGFGYFGIGFYGGYWGGGRFWYNRAYCNIGAGRGFYAYTHPYNGYTGRPGGASFVRTNSYAGARTGAVAAYRGGTNYAANRGSSINGNVRASGFAQSSYNGASHGYSGTAGNYAQPSGQARPAYSSGGSSHSAPTGGGGYHGGGGGGGGSHGGGGGHR